MELVTEDGASKTGATMNVPLINSEAELNKMITGADPTLEGDENQEGADEDDSEQDHPAGKKKVEKKVEQKATKKVKQEGAFGVDDSNDDTDESDESDENEDNQDQEEFDEEKEYPTSIHYLNAKFGLNMNVKAVPANLTRAQEAETIAEMFDAVRNSARQEAESFKPILELLKDEEVATVLRAKREGKTLKDVFEAYTQSTEGMTDDQLVENDVRLRYPGAKPEFVKKFVDGMKATNEFETFVKDLRTQRKGEETSKAQLQLEQAKKLERENAALAVEEEKNYTRFVQDIKHVYGIPVTPKMKQDMVKAATRRDNKGMTAIDYALQSDKGIALMALAITNLDTIIKSKKSVLKAQGKNSLFQTLIGDPKELQSSSAGTSKHQSEEIPDDVINSFS